ncbi:hypothetical protein DNTS_017807 [Danionella cerebrum]|uniref:Uncharacterized protein n=1 Tax=Danionella cerebrum TaxID=2873325 RepID=A0A553NH74_9TELE|nr:hypothetical protein DNTS_017807 [Danionella translucida]
MVSRLPKFSSRPSSSTVTPLPVSALPVSSLESKGGPPATTQIRSLNWRKGEERSANKSGSFDEEKTLNKDSQSPVLATKKPSPTTGDKCKSSVPRQQTRNLKSIPHPSKIIPRTTNPNRLSMGNYRYNGVTTPNGVNNGKSHYGSSENGFAHVSQQRTFKSKLSLSNDSLKSTSKENVVRSQSFPHFKRAASRTDQPMTRSLSLNKATELAKELPRPLAQSPLARSTIFQPNSASSEGKVEDMSLSSSSSLEHNDTDEVYMDDFDNLGNGGETLLLPVIKDGMDRFGLCEDDDTIIIKCNEKSSVTRFQGFLSETVDWAGMGFTEDDFVDGASSPMGDFPHGSSLDLSPSDSSGGTYMWDEEGMEALGDSGLPCGSFDSDLRSMDLLNHLENSESCGLEEDDLMLDLDLSEDVSFSDTDGMSSYESSEKDNRPTQRRKHWGMLENSAAYKTGFFQAFDEFVAQGTERPRSESLGSGPQVLDEVTLTHMAQDCTSVKEQLLQLETLLQVALLLKEVEELRNELRSKDRMITELSQQLVCEDMQCHCFQRSDANVGSSELLDKDTQTIWRPQNGMLFAPIISSWRHSQPASVRPCVPRQHHRQSESLNQASQTSLCTSPCVCSMPPAFP